MYNAFCFLAISIFFIYGISHKAKVFFLALHTLFCVKFSAVTSGFHFMKPGLEGRTYCPFLKRLRMNCKFSDERSNPRQMGFPNCMCLWHIGIAAWTVFMFSAIYVFINSNFVVTCSLCILTYRYHNKFLQMFDTLHSFRSLCVSKSIVTQTPKGASCKSYTLKSTKWM